jgi:hypothetical protein
MHTILYINSNFACARVSGLSSIECRLDPVRVSNRTGTQESLEASTRLIYKPILHKTYTEEQTT